MKELRASVLAVCCVPALSLACGSSPAQSARDAEADAWPADAAAVTFVPSNLPANALAFDGLEDLVIGADCGGAEATIDTDSGAISGCPTLVAGRHYRFAVVAQTDGGMAALLMTRSGQIQSGMRVMVRGRLPLVLVAAHRIDIAGLIDAAALGSAPPAGGAAPPPPVKGPGNGPGGGGGAAPGGGGGGGGAYCGLGGKGGPS